MRKGDPQSIQQYPRLLVVQHELVEILLLNEPKQREKEVQIEALNTLKLDILLTNKIMQDRGDHVVDMLL